ncbi:MAG: RNA polymerase-associated protein rapA [Gammaproteobacteria bacterium]
MKRSILFSSMALALSIPGLTLAEFTTSGYVKNETGFMISGGQYVGEATTALDTDAQHDTLYKFENSARVFGNGDLGEESSFHVDINAIYDTDAINGYRGHESFTQNDWLRELYFDTRLGDFDIRVGKQQVVWGTADGIKLLDIINPTDFRELNQNTMEDSRIPIWMVNVERPVGDTGNVQFILSQNEENKIPGLNGGGDAGHPFILKGVDSITGRVNGFLNVAPALSRVAASFENSAAAGGFDTTGNGVGNPQATGLTGFGGLSVDGFAGANQNVNNVGLATQNITAPGIPAPAGSTAIPGATLLNNIAQGGINPAGTDSNANGNVTNLVAANWQPGAADSAFEYMPNASFATFNTFAGSSGTATAGLGGLNTSFAGVGAAYVKDHPDKYDPNWGFRYKANLDNGFNFSLNYFNHYDANPVVNVAWHDQNTGEKLTTVYATPGDFNGDTAPDFADPTGSGATAFGAPGASNGGTVTRSQIPTDLSVAGTTPVSVLLRNDNAGSTQAGRYYGGFAPNPTLALSPNDPQLRFTESLNRINSFGSSFDYAFEAGDLPVVLRGEFLYDMDVSVPVVDRLALSIGDLENALTTQEVDMFKYVVGVDVTILTNLLISTQFIQFVNTDYVEENQTCTTANGTNFDCSRYTGDAATLHMSNGLQQGEEYKEFVSLFLSKPFGNEQQHRVNNITILEDTGGIWNRLDVEYAFTDRFIGTAELNIYAGDKDSTFGQLQDSTNMQVGMKYLFD